MKRIILFYDGPCAFCNYWIQKLCDWDRDDQLRFASLDSQLFIDFTKERNIDSTSFDSVVAWDKQYSYAIEAEAVFMVLDRLGGGWKIIAYLKYLPKSLTQFVYQMVAKNRYRWFGKHPQCPIPEARYRHKFIVD